ncbi:MAG: hypothetical protein ACJ72N_21965 [Labedaea sp.]
MGPVVTKVTDAGADVLEVRGTLEGVVDEGGQPLELVAFGWVSAMENQYDPAAYDEEGYRDPDAQARAMTDEERRAYWAQLLLDVAGVMVTPAPRVLYEAPGAG